LPSIVIGDGAHLTDAQPGRRRQAHDRSVTTGLEVAAALQERDEARNVVGLGDRRWAVVVDDAVPPHGRMIDLDLGVGGHGQRVPASIHERLELAERSA
jgi:hypothetical protein